MNSMQKYEAAQKVIEFAKSLGFDKAQLAVWPDDVEEGFPTIEEALQDSDPADYRISIGLYLNADLKVKVTDDAGNRIQIEDRSPLNAEVRFTTPVLESPRSGVYRDDVLGRFCDLISVSNVPLIDKHGDKVGLIKDARPSGKSLQIRAIVTDHDALAAINRVTTKFTVMATSELDGDGSTRLATIDLNSIKLTY